MLQFPKPSIIALLLAVVMALSIGGGLRASGPSTAANLPTTLDVDPMPAFAGAGDATTSVNSVAGRGDTLSLEENVSAVSLINGDFEQGQVGWEEYSPGDFDLIVRDLMVLPHSGEWAVWMGSPDETSYIQQPVTVPISNTFLVYWHYIDSVDACGNDYGRLLIDDKQVDKYDLCEEENTDRWVPHSVDLTDYAGKDVVLQIRAETNEADDSDLYIDDVSFEAEAMVESVIYLPLVLNVPVTVEILNGDFEEGPTDWLESSDRREHVILHQDDPLFVMTPHSGEWAALLGAEDNESSSIQQEVTVPPTAPYLVYWHWISSSDECGYDVGDVLISGSIVKEYDLCSAENTMKWVQHSLDVSAYVGQTVLLQIRAETDEDRTSSLYIDDVSFQSSAAVSTE